MKRLFIHTAIFSKKIEPKNGDSLILAIEEELLKNVEAGDLVPGIAGIRKMRIANPARGKRKRGGYRVLYLDVPHREKTYLLYFYGKDESEDLTGQEKKLLKELAGVLKGESHG